MWRGSLLQGLDEDPLAERILVSAMITGWDIHRLSPEVLIRESLGQAGELEVETKVLKQVVPIRLYPESSFMCLRQNGLLGMEASCESVKCTRSPS